MRRPAVLLAVTALALPLLGLTPGTEAATEVRHLRDVDQFGTPGHDEVRGIDAAGDVVASAGVVTGALPGQTSGGGTDAFVRVVTVGVDEEWTRQLGGAGPDSAADVATDGERVLVGGHSEAGIGDMDPGGWLILLDENGDLDQTFVVPDGGAVAAVALAGDSVYAAGTVDGRGTVWSFDAAGGITWTASLTDFGPDSGAYATGNQLLVLDDQVIVTEQIIDEADDGTRTYALDTATGGENWATSIAYGGSTGLATDGEQIFVSRWSQDFDTYRYLGRLLALNADGSRSWSEELFEREDIDYDARAVVWDGSAVVAVSESALVAFSPAGRRRWIKRLPEGLDPAVATFAPGYYARGLYVGGRTTRALGGPRLGGRDAVVGRFVLYQPDARVRVGPTVYGDDRYSKPGQRLTLRVAPGRSTSVRLAAQNDGEVVQPLRLKGCRGRDGYDVRYRYGSTDLTREMTRRRGYRANAIGPDGVSLVKVTIRASRHAERKSMCGLFVGSIVTGERDRFTLVIRRR